MNHSGLAVREWLNRGDWGPEDLLVLHDEVDLPRGVLRLKMGGGTAGHNGLKSIVEETGVSEFGRLRVGVGRAVEIHKDLAHYLLAPFSEEEMDAFVPIVRSAEKAVELWWIQGMKKAMNVVNRREDEMRGGEKEDKAIEQ
jgi:PTH1 family peptidyl-tRNA hydrolase